MKSKAVVMTAALLGLSLGACSSSSHGGSQNPPPPGNPPVISAMTLSHDEIALGATADLTVTASDPDGDAMTYTFSRGACDGSLSGGVEGTPQSANRVTFTAGSTAGACQLGVTVTDSHGLATQGTVTIHLAPTLVVTPIAPAILDNVASVEGDGAPGFQAGSIKATGTPKAELYFTPSELFGRAVTLGDVARMSYWTKKSTTHVEDVHDWYLTLYTAPYAGQAKGWYGARIGAEPYLAANLAETVNAWNAWSTNGQTNQLRFYESSYGYFGSYTDPSWSDFVAGSSLTGANSGTPVPYASQPILYFSVQTASTAAGFDGQLDGVRIELKDGSVVVIDLQPSPPIVPVFDTIPAVLPPSLPSQPFQAQQTAEFGDVIALAPGTARHAFEATVVMVTWSTDALAAFPITLNVYDASDLTKHLATKTQTFDLPARPPADSTCSDPSQWRDATGQCHNGYAFPITFDLSGLGVVLPDTFAYGIAYNTETWGYAPIGVPGPYNSLNVGLVGDGKTAASTQPSIGSDPDPDSVLWNTATATNYADGGAGGVGTFRPDTKWTGYAPAVEFFAY